MLCAAQEEISLWPMMDESVLSLAADLLAADPAILETRIPEKSQLGENSRLGFESTNRTSHPEKIAAKSTLALGVSWFRRSGTAVGSGVVYDGDGNRVSETAAGVTTKYLVDTLNPTGYSQVLDELVNGSVTKTYTYGLQRISENQLSGSTWTPSFYGYDGHGNVRFTTSTAGTLGNTYQFDAFGMPIASTGTIANTYLYRGERFDSNLNLYHLRARYYNMLTGRFETMDPAAGKITDPRTLHKYIYSANNPVNASDPTGRDIFEEGSFFKSLVATITVAAIFGEVLYADYLCLAEKQESLSGEPSSPVPVFTGPHPQLPNVGPPSTECFGKPHDDWPPMGPGLPGPPSWPGIPGYGPPPTDGPSE
jgi:RHS repeat-associated protein